MKRFNRLLATLLMGLLLTPAALAQQMEGSGYAVYVPQSAKHTKLADGRTMVNDHIAGVLIADDPNSPLHLATHDCLGTNLLGADGMPQSTGSSCTAMDAEGDVWWLSFINLDGNGRWHITGGTGKYAGMEGGGTTELLSVSPDGRITIRWTGTWTMAKAGG